MMRKQARQGQNGKLINMPLRVQFSVTNEIFYLSRVSMQETIHDLKRHIELETGIPFELQELSYLDAGDLPNDQTIKNMDIVPNAIVTLKVWHTWNDLVKASCSNNIELVLSNGVTQDSSYQTATSEYMLPKQRMDWLRHRSAVALFIACHRSHFEMARRLLQSGANVNCTTAASRSPLHVAAAKNNYEIIDLLLKNGADIDLVDKDASSSGGGDGKTPLAVAAEFGHKVCERRLFMHRWEKRAYATAAAAAPSGQAGLQEQQQLFEFQRSDSSNPRWRVGPQAQVYLEATASSASSKEKKPADGAASGPSSAGKDGKSAISYKQWQAQKRQERSKQQRLQKQKSEQLEKQTAGKRNSTSTVRANGVIDDQLLSQLLIASQTVSQEDSQLQPKQQHQQERPGAIGGLQQRALRRIDPHLNAYEQWLKDRSDNSTGKPSTGGRRDQGDNDPHELLPYQLMIEEFCRAKCSHHEQH